MVRPAKSSSALPRSSRNFLINAASKMSSAQTPKSDVVKTTEGSGNARLRSCFEREISHLPHETVDHLHTYIRPKDITPSQTGPIVDLDSTPIALSSSSSSEEIDAVRVTSKMDLAPDHFEYTDPQSESSSAAAARAEHTAPHTPAPHELPPLSSEPQPPHLMSGALDLACSSESDTAGPISSGPESGTATPPTSADERQDEVNVYNIRYKSKPAGPKLCTWHEVCWQTQYTRPAVDLFQEILEVRYPEPGRSGGVTYWHRLLAGVGLGRQAHGAGDGGVVGDDETTPLVSTGVNER